MLHFTAIVYIMFTFGVWLETASSVGHVAAIWAAVLWPVLLGLWFAERFEGHF